MKRLVVIVFSLIFIQPLFAQWQMMNSPLATPEITKLSVAPNGYIYAQTSNKELFRSDDNGLTWSKISTLINSANNFTFGSDGKIYATSGGGIAISTDLGLTWERKELTLDGSITDIEITNSGYIIACEYYLDQYYMNGIYVSTNGGSQWTKVTTGLDGEALIGMCKDSFGNLYALTVWGAIFKSTDEGYNWTLKIDLPGVAFDIELDSNNKIFAASSSSGTTSQAIFRSTDLGNTWVMVNPQMTFNLFIDEQNNIYAGNFNQLQISTDGGDSWISYNNISSEIRDVSAINGKTFTGTLKGVRITEDLGNNWKLGFKDPARYCKVNDLIKTSSGKIIAGTVDGIYSTTNDGINWDSTFVNQNVSTIETDRLGNIYTSTYQLYISNDDGNTWSNCLPAGSSISNFHVSANNSVIANGYINNSGSIFRTTDQGVNWLNLGEFGSINGVGSIQSVNQDTSGYVLFGSYMYTYVPGGYIIEEKYLWRTSNNGSDWNVIQSNIYFTDIQFFNDTLYLTARNTGYFNSPAGIYKSPNKGATLIPINNGIINKNGKKIRKSSSNILICLTDDGIYRSLNYGEYWTKLNLSGLVSTAINSFYCDKNGILYAATNNGIGVFIGELPVELTSFNASITQNKVQLNWETATELNNNGFEVQRKLENSDWITIGFVQGKGTTTEPTTYTYLDDVSDFISNKIYYRLKQIDYNGNYEFSNEVEVITLPLEYSLSQNYPNPFNPTTKIKYEVPENTNVTLEVFDVLGRLIKTLVNENKSAGRYEVEFNASELSSGLYLYKISAVGFEQTRKMVLLK